jgi:uncharacterized membrane protein (DUF441 family)
MAYGTTPLSKEKDQRQMIGVTLVLLAVSVASLLFKDYLLAAAAALLLVLSLSHLKPALDVLQKYSFSTGIFFLMVFILLPIATQKIKLGQSFQTYLNWPFIIAVLAGIFISYLGGVGVKAMPQFPNVLLGVIIGTLIATLFLKGLPAGLIIAAGVVGILMKYLN